MHSKLTGDEGLNTDPGKFQCFIEPSVHVVVKHAVPNPTLVVRFPCTPVMSTLSHLSACGKYERCLNRWRLLLPLSMIPE